MTQLSTSRHSSSLTTPILNLRAPQSVSFILRLPKTISLLILGQKRVLPPMPLPLHPLPTRASLKPRCQIPLKNHPTLYPHIDLTIQGNILTQFQILYQLTFLVLNPHTCNNLLQLNYLQNNLHQFLLYPQKYTLPVEIPQACLIYPHLIILQKNWPEFLFPNQVTLPV